MVSSINDTTLTWALGKINTDPALATIKKQIPDTNKSGKVDDGDIIPSPISVKIDKSTYMIFSSHGQLNIEMPKKAADKQKNTPILQTAIKALRRFYSNTTSTIGGAFAQKEVFVEAAIKEMKANNGVLSLEFIRGFFREQFESIDHLKGRAISDKGLDGLLGNQNGALDDKDNWKIDELEVLADRSEENKINYSLRGAVSFLEALGSDNIRFRDKDADVPAFARLDFNKLALTDGFKNDVDRAWRVYSEFFKNSKEYRKVKTLYSKIQTDLEKFNKNKKEGVSKKWNDLKKHRKFLKVLFKASLARFEETLENKKIHLADGVDLEQAEQRKGYLTMFGYFLAKDQIDMRLLDWAPMGGSKISAKTLLENRAKHGPELQEFIITKPKTADNPAP